MKIKIFESLEYIIGCSESYGKVVRNDTPWTEVTRGEFDALCNWASKQNQKAGYSGKKINIVTEIFDVDIKTCVEDYKKEMLKEVEQQRKLQEKKLEKKKKKTQQDLATKKILFEKLKKELGA